jgi:hypothetical protein
LIFFVTAILAFVWRTGAAADPTPEPLDRSAALVARICITALFLLGVVYLALIVNTFRNYSAEDSSGTDRRESSDEAAQARDQVLPERGRKRYSAAKHNVRRETSIEVSLGPVGHQGAPTAAVTEKTVRSGVRDEMDLGKGELLTVL